MADQNKQKETDQKKLVVGSKVGKEYGQTGTFVFNGIITSEEYNRDLTGLNGLKMFDTMRRSDSTVHSVLQACKLPILGLTYGIDPASDDATDEEVADFVKRELFERNINWDDMAREALTFFDFGYSVAEKTFELTTFNGKTRIGLHKIGFRLQRSITAWETSDHQPGITQQLVNGNASIPLEKLIVWTNEKEGDNYEGISLLRFAYKDWDMKDKLSLVNAIALEKQGVGVPKLTRPTDADTGDINKARESLRQMRANEEAYLEVPQGWEVEFMDMKGSTTKEIIPTIQYHDRQIALSVLAQFLMLGASDSSGSRAVSEDHSKLFYLAEEAAVKNLVSVLQQQLVKQICDLNWADLPNGYPKLKASKVADDDIVALAGAYKQFVEAKLVTPELEVEEHVRKMAHLPEMSDALKKNYEQQQRARDEALKTGQKPNKDENPDDPKPADPTVKASAIAELKSARKRAIDILVRE